MHTNQDNQHPRLTLKSFFSGLFSEFLSVFLSMAIAFVVGTVVSAAVLTYYGFPLILALVGGLVALGITLGVVLAFKSTVITDLF